MDRIATYAAFWPFYLGEHSRPACRALHYLGTLAAFACLAAAVATLNAWFLAGAALAGYGPAWIGHFVIEGNRPASFRHPLWSLRGDLHMLALAATGRLGAELARLDGTGDRPGERQ